MRVLVINAGSSTLKTSLVADGRSIASTDEPWQRANGGEPDRAATLRTALGAALGGHPSGATEAIGAVDAVVHRVVHGGPHLTSPVRLDDAVVASIEAVSALAPLHNVAAVATIAVARAELAGLPHVACFDTAFHAGLPESAIRYPVPEAWHAELGIRRFGFHGLSVEWAVERAGALLGRPGAGLAIVVAHLGGGCSVTAVEGGRSRWTSMGFTPLEGLMMGTRSGSLDPGILLHLLRTGARQVAELAEDLDRRSGLLGVSGRSADVRELQAAADAGDKPAALALAMFVERAAAGIAAAATALSRLDAVAFTGGIGEHAGRVRAAVVERLAVLGLRPVAADDPGDDAVLTAAGPRVGGPAVLRVTSREDLVMAAAATALLEPPD